MANKPKRQHYISRTYLKQFRIDNHTSKGFLYCVNLGLRKPLKVQKIGLKDQIFIKEKYYNHNSLADPYDLEKTFGEEIEPIYSGIIDCLASEEAIHELLRMDIILWIFTSKMRNPIFRDNTQRLMKFVKSPFGNILTNEELKSIQQDAKWAHLATFLDKEKLDRMWLLYLSTLSAKHWRVLKAPANSPFIGSDNPGFSPNVHPIFRKETPFHHVTELNSHSIIYYVFSPIYCLEISPFLEGTPLKVNAMNMQIKFEIIDSVYVKYINAGTIFTAYRSVFSHSQTCLELSFIDNIVGEETEEYTPSV